jgi:hypothetical protein
MIGGCLISASYPFLVDVYTKKRIVSDNSGHIDYKWQFWKILPCWAGPFTSTSFKAQGTTEVFGDQYFKKSYLKLLTPEDIGRNVQVANIRNKRTGEVIFNEVELRGSPATWYNSNGSSPVLDPYGRVIQWDTLISRSEQQGEKVNV